VKQYHQKNADSPENINILVSQKYFVLIMDYTIAIIIIMTL